MRKADSYRSAKKAKARSKGGGKKGAIPPKLAPVSVPPNLAAALSLSGAAASANVLAIKEAAAQASKLTIEDVDKAMEAALTRHQKAGGEAPLELSPTFAARARHLGWVENVEFKEVRK
jgi:hypothetical protein